MPGRFLRELYVVTSGYFARWKAVKVFLVVSLHVGELLVQEDNVHIPLKADLDALGAARRRQHF